MDPVTPFSRGQVKSLTSLWSCTANELAVRCCVSAARDITYVTSRVEHEGFPFLGITLADYGKAFERSLDRGHVAPWGSSSFEVSRLTGFPLFLGGFLERVFDACNGALLNSPDVEAVYAIRQLTLMFSKTSAPMEERRVRRAMSGYVQCESDVVSADDRLDPQYLEDFRRMSALLFGDVFSKVDRDVHWGRIIPRQGPGSVADRLSQNEKWNQRTWTERLTEAFGPAESYLEANLRCLEYEPRDYDIREPGSEVPVRVISVPKTVKTPRIIAIEPTVMQYMQQGLDRAIRSAIREDWFLSKLIGLSDQDPNREMARSGSLTGELATLDLSEASDRVSNLHVSAMLEDWPDLHRAIQATRSLKADVKDEGVLPLSKYASMGSALCFVMEAMVFATVIFLAIERELGAPLSRGVLIQRFHEQVRVYGDDLIVPTDYARSVVFELDAFGHRVNEGKSFWTGRFRESCGKEYFDGQDVSIVKVRGVLPNRRTDASAVISSVALRNLAYWAGLWQTARFLDNHLGKLLRYYPNVAPSSALLGRESALGYQFDTLHPSHHSPITKGYYVVARSQRDHLDGPGALLKCLIAKEGEYGQSPGLRKPPRRLDVASVDDDHLERTGRPEHVSIKLGRRCPF